MPSGSKKRKAAKKKKELGATHDQNNHHQQQPHTDVSQAHGDDDLKHHDGKESECEEVSSPPTQDHANHQHQFTDGKKEEVEKTDDRTRVQLLSDENKFTDETIENGVVVKKCVMDYGVPSEGDSKTVGEFNINNIIEEHVEPQMKSGDGVLSEIGDEGSVVQIDRENKNFEKLDSNNAALQDVEHEQKSSGGGLPQGDIGESHIIDKINVVVDNSPFASFTGAANSLFEGPIQVLNPVPVGELYGSVVESGMDNNAESVSEKMSMDTVTSEDSLKMDNVVIHGIDDNGKKEDNELDQKDASLCDLGDSGLGKNKDEPIVATNDAFKVSDEKNSATPETKEIMFLPDIAPRDEATNFGNASSGVEYVKYLEVHESSVNQPLLESAAQPVQRTSWLSCCGLFDVLAGSNR